MPNSIALLIRLLVVILPSVAMAQGAPDAQKRIALVIGNAAYPNGALATTANDAGLIAQTLEAAGFDVVGARDLDQDGIRKAFRGFLDKAQGMGQNTAAFVYLSGYGLQLDGENYLLPVDARIARPADVAAQAIRISDYTRPLAAFGLKAAIVVLDVARVYPFQTASVQMAGGLALTEPEPGTLFAYSAAPDTVTPEATGPYGPYAQSLSEMMREGGLPLNEVFDRVRLRVNELTHGGQIPWHSSHIDGSFVFFERAPDAPPPPVAIEQRISSRARPIRDFTADDAYVAALDRDTISGYLEFLTAYPDHPMAGRVRAIVAARREAITWRRTRNIDTPEAYWSYLDRYPGGRHAAEARSRLAYLRALLEPPPTFTVIDYDVPPPPPEEYVYIERRVLVFDDPVFAFAPPPPPPVYFLAPPPPYFVLPPPPLVAVIAFGLPIPVYQPVPIWVRPPVYVAPPPPNNVIFNNIHNTVVINNTTNIVTITNRQGQTTTLSPPAAPAAPGTPNVATASVGPSLPPSIAQKANLTQQTPPPTQPGGTPPPGGTPQLVPGQSSSAQPTAVPNGQPLSGAKGLPLPLVVPNVKAPTSPSALAPNARAPTSPGAIAPFVGQPPANGRTAVSPALGQPPTAKQAAQPQQGSLPLRKSNSLPKAGPETNSGAPIAAVPNKTLGPDSRTPNARHPIIAPEAKIGPDSKNSPPVDTSRQKQLELQRQQDQQRKAQAELQRQQQQRQAEVQRQREAEAQRRRQIDQQRQQDAQRQRQVEAQRQQQRDLQLQRQREAEAQRRRQIEQQRQQDVQRQRQSEAQRQQQRQPNPSQQSQRKECGHPGQPACPR